MKFVERTLNMFPPFVVSVSVLYLIKHRILIRMRFIDIKSLHVMYYLPFDRFMGL